MGRESAAGKLVTDYLRRFPAELSLTLAKRIYREHPDKFNDVEHVRKFIRHRRRANGERSRTKNTLDVSLIREQQPIGEWMKNFHLPEEDDPQREIVFPKLLQSTLLLSDIHFPEHNLKAIEIALEYGDKVGIDSIILNGDTIDCYQISTFPTSPTKRNILYEFDMTQEFLDMLRSAFPKAKIYFKVGNHEERYERFFMTKAPQLFGDPFYSMEHRLGLIERGISYIPSRSWIKYGKLNVMHGHEFGKSVFSPVNPARGIFLRANCSTIVGHYHQSSHHAQNNLNGDAMACWSTGCLSTLSPDYRPTAMTKWNHGFALLRKDNSGEFEVENKRIINGKIR